MALLHHRCSPLARKAGTILAATLFLSSVPGLGSQEKPPATKGTEPANRIPAYHKHAPNGSLPATLSPETFPAGSIQRKAYAMAAKIKAVLYQEPCYCYCDRDEHHHSLLDCYRTRHASNCGICMGEAIYAYEQTQKGRTPAEIRQSIIRGDWRTALAKR